MPIDPLCTRSVPDLADMLRRREVSSVEVVKAHVNRIKKVNPYINAVIQERFDAAFHEAAEADRQLSKKSRARKDLPPFLGVPFTTKEHYQVAGFPQTAGLLSRKNAVQDRDAVLVKRLRDAGMILLGTTNVPEALTWFESYNKVYGRTTNAYSVHHIPGGSSGGEAAIIGAGGSPVGLGGDIGGSIRNPAFFNGIVGHKPTGRRVPETGCWPGSGGKIGVYRVSGPLGRRVADVAAVMPLLAQPDGIDLTVTGPPWGTRPEYDPRDITVYWFEKVLVGASPDVREGLHRAVEGLQRQGFKVEQWRPPEIHRGLELWIGALGDAGGAKFIETVGDFKPVKLGRQWAKWPLRRSDHIFPVLALATIEKIVGKLRQQGLGEESEALRLRLQATLEERLSDHSVLLYPGFHTTAPRHRFDAVRALPGFVNAAMLNPMELPSTQVPTGFGSRTGLPTGVLVAGARNQDHLTLFVAEQLEQALGGWQPGPIRGTHID